MLAFLQPMIIIVMGVSGSGKTTLGQHLALRLGWSFLEGDDLHPPANREKMARGVPLTDDDRQPWLRAIREQIAAFATRGESAVVTCSALKQAYRAVLSAGPEPVVFVYVKGTYDLIRGRLARRQGHYMPVSLLENQFQVLEEPKAAIEVDARLSTEVAVEEIVRRLPSP